MNVSAWKEEKRKEEEWSVHVSDEPQLNASVDCLYHALFQQSTLESDIISVHSWSFFASW